MANKKMLRSAMLVLALTGMVMTTPTALTAGDGEEKWTICHVPPGNPENAHTITVGFPAVVAHFANHSGDTYGECGAE